MPAPMLFLSLSLDAGTASELGYQAVHLGATSDIESVRQSYPELTVGYSAHSLVEIRDKHADYYTLSPIFHTDKEYEVKPLGPVDVSPLGREVYALGGITSENASRLAGLGYTGVAGISFYKELELLSSISIS